jgi:ATP-dependent DNA helicase RecG
MNLESQLLEWKSSWRDEYLKWICGYANAQGGVLEIGKDDKGVAVGIDNPKRLLEDIPSKVKNSMGILPDVNLEWEDNLPYISIRVLPYYSPISYHSRYYFRTGSSMHEIVGRELDEFMLKKMGRTWDSMAVPGLSLGDLDPNAFKVFRDKAVKSGRLKNEDLDMSDEQLLENLGLYDGDKLRMATILLFHPKPSTFVTGAYIKIGFFNENDELLYQDEIQSSLITIVDRVMELLYFKYFKGIIHYEGIQRVDQYPVERSSMREAILNSIIHNDYVAYNPIQIRVYDNKVIIFNSGGLPENWSTQTLFEIHPSLPRNPNIASAIFKTGMIEAWGGGIRKIVAGCRSIDAPDPVFDTLGNTISIALGAPEDAIFKSRVKSDGGNSPNGNRTQPNATERKPVKSRMQADSSKFLSLLDGDRLLVDRAQQIVGFVNDHGGIASKDVQELLGIKKTAASVVLSRLIDAGVLVPVGESRQRFYRLAE